MLHFSSLEQRKLPFKKNGMKSKTNPSQMTQLQVDQPCLMSPPLHLTTPLAHSRPSNMMLPVHPRKKTFVNERFPWRLLIHAQSTS